MGDVQLDYAVPAANLQQYVTLFYLFRSDLVRFEDVERADYAQLRFRFSSAPTGYRFVDGVSQASTEIHLLGPTCGAVRSWSEGPVRLFGMGLTPAGWAAIVGSDASHLLNRSVEATALLGAPRLLAAYQALADADGIAAAVVIAEQLVRDLVRDQSGAAIGFVRQVDSWLNGAPSPDIRELIDATGLSRRQVERKCKALYGAPPKLLARKYRALKAAVALACEAETLDDAIERGFYDQSHMIREVKQFTGVTPRRFHAEPALLSQLVTAQRTALDGLVSPLISRT